jgi:YD repeat-containing protein
VAGFVTNPPTSAVTVTVDASIDSVTRTFYDRDGNVRGTLDAEGYLVEYVYDAAGRKIEEVRYVQSVPAELRAAYSFSAVRANVNTSNASNRRTRFYYDARGLLRYRLDLENSATNASRITGYQYTDYSARLFRTVEYYNRTTVWSYDIAAVHASVVGHSADRLTTLTLDSAGRVVTSVDPAGTPTSYTYDSAGNVAKVRHGRSPATGTTRAATCATASIRPAISPGTAIPPADVSSSCGSTTLPSVPVSAIARPSRRWPRSRLAPSLTRPPGTTMSAASCASTMAPAPSRSTSIAPPECSGRSTVATTAGRERWTAARPGALTTARDG